MSLKELARKHWAKVAAFVAGWAAEAQVDLSAWLVAAKSLLGL